jgi:ketosteroid isomerase-like protein
VAHGTESDLELVRRGFAALADGGVDALLEFVHPEFEMETLPGIAAEPQIYRGHEGIRRWFESFYEVMDEVKVEPASAEQLEPVLVLLELNLRARGQASGLEVTQAARTIATVQDGLLYRLEFLMPESAVKQGGE